MGPDQQSPTSTSEDRIFEGMDVFDSDDRKIGRVVGYNRALGYIETEGTFGGHRYIPFLAVESVGPTGAHLNVTKDTVANVYDHMPAVRPEFTPEGKPTGGGTALSGYDRGRVPLDADAIAVVRDKIQAGTSVYDADDLKVGELDAYNRETGYMRIQKGTFSFKDLYLPVTSVAYLDDIGIHLTVTKNEIAHRFSHVPDIARRVFES
jgi:hypothetical protein